MSFLQCFFGSHGRKSILFVACFQIHGLLAYLFYRESLLRAGQPDGHKDDCNISGT